MPLTGVINYVFCIYICCFFCQFLSHDKVR